MPTLGLSLSFSGGEHPTSIASLRECARLTKGLTDAGKRNLNSLAIWMGTYHSGHPISPTCWRGSSAIQTWVWPAVAFMSGTEASIVLAERTEYGLSQGPSRCFAVCATNQ